MATYKLYGSVPHCTYYISSVGSGVTNYSLHSSQLEKIHIKSGHGDKTISYLDFYGSSGTTFSTIGYVYCTDGTHYVLGQNSFSSQDEAVDFMKILMKICGVTARLSTFAGHHEIYLSTGPGYIYAPTVSGLVTAIDMDKFLRKCDVELPAGYVLDTYVYVGKYLDTNYYTAYFNYSVSGGSSTKYTILNASLDISVLATALAEWGITVDTSSSSSGGYGVFFNKTINQQAEKITKLYSSVSNEATASEVLYASVSGEATRVYGKKNPPLPYAYVTYYTDANHTTTSIAAVDDSSTFNSLCGASGNTWTVTLNGTTVNNTDIKEVMATERVMSMDTFFLRGCTALDRVDISKTKITSLIGFLWNCTNFNSSFTLPDTLTSVSYLLSGCSSFNQPLTIPSSVTSIGGNFLYGCSSFNQPLTIPSSVTSIGVSFLYRCTSFNQPLTIPSSVTSIGTSFLYSCDEMTSTVDIGSLAATVFDASNNTLATTSSTAAMYTTGVTISGTNKSAFLTRFPNRTSTPYRKLL